MNDSMIAYAVLDASSQCTDVLEFGQSVTNSNYIQLSEYDDTYLGREYDKTALAWKPVPQVTEKPCINVPDISVVGISTSPSSQCKKIGEIWWLDKATGFRATGMPVIPDAIKPLFANETAFVLMAEKVIDGDTPQGDVRFKATLKDDGFTLQSTAGFAESGNYIIRAKRLNEGLNRIKAPFKVDFKTIEFDVLQG